MQATSIDQFCKDHGLSRTHFYELQRKGEGPRVMMVGRRRLISIEAAADWRRRMEVQPAGKQREFA